MSFTLFSKQQTDIAPLVVFRIVFGLVMLAGVIRFVSLGWVDDLYIKPDFFFKYYGFKWVKSLGVYTYALFAIMGVCSLCIALGYRYRLAMGLFFLSFTYVELIDKTTYLNHYYFISCLSFLMFFLPANADTSIDVIQGRAFQRRYIYKWHINAVKLFIVIVYIYASIAKWQVDWLIHAQPMKIWLSQRFPKGFLGVLFAQEWICYVLSWAGMLYDLIIPFLLLYPYSRVFGYVLVIVFHGLTAWFFQIGMFPFIMIASGLIFFSGEWHRRLLNTIPSVAGIRVRSSHENHDFSNIVSKIIIVVFFTFQIAMPLRHWSYPDNVIWHEQGFRYSWQVMVMEKRGYCHFLVKPFLGREFYVEPQRFLTIFQRQQLVAQPDFILEFAHFLSAYYEEDGVPAKVFADSYVSLNGRMSRRFIDPDVDLSKEKDTFKNKDWILRYEL